MALAAIGLIVVMGSLLLPRRDAGKIETPHLEESQREATPIVRVIGHRMIGITPGSPMERHLARFTVAKETTTDPLLTVTGAVVARIRPGATALADRWQFAGADLANTYSDWHKNNNDLNFRRTQVDKTRELTLAREARNKDAVERLRPLAPLGTVPIKDLRIAEADLLQAQLEGQKEVFEAETALRVAEQTKASLERTLGQQGIDPVVLQRAREGMVLILANVPESRISLVREGQSCLASFYGLPDQVFTAHVEHLGETLLPERRTLRVLFDLNDSEYRLRPGMFAEVGLGTDPREALLIPTASVVHVGRADYALVERAPDRLEVVEIKVGECRGDRVEIVSGLHPGDVIISNGAVLFKPTLIAALARDPDPSTIPTQENTRVPPSSPDPTSPADSPKSISPRNTNKDSQRVLKLTRES